MISCSMLWRKASFWLTALAAVVLCASAPARAAWTVLSSPGQSVLAVLGGPEVLAAARTARLVAVGQSQVKGVVLVDPDAGVVLGSVTLPNQPIALAVKADGSRIYVLSDDDKEVHVIDSSNPAAPRLIASWPVPGVPVALVLNQDESELLVATQTQAKILALNPQTGAVQLSQSLPSAPVKLALGLAGTRVLVGIRGGTLLALDAVTLHTVSTARIADEILGLSWWDTGNLAILVHKRADGVSLVDVATGQVAAFVALDGDPEHGVTDHDTAYITTQDDFSVNRVNLRERKLEGRYAIPERAGGAIFDPVSKTLIVSQTADDRLLKIDPEQASLLEALVLKKRLKDIAVNNVTHEAAAIADKADELSRIKLLDRSVQTLPLPPTPRALALDSALNLAIVALAKSKDELAFADLSGATPVLLPERVNLPDEVNVLATDSTRALTVAVSGGKRVHVIDNASRTLAATITGADKYRLLAIHSGQGLAYLVTSNNELTLFDLNTRSLGQTVALGFAPNSIAIDETLNLAVLTTDRNNRVQLLDLNTLTPVQNFTLPRHPGNVAINADTHVAVITSKESNALSLLDLNTRTLTANFNQLDKPKQLAITSRYNQALVLSAESDEIAFVQLRNPAPTLTEIVPAQANQGAAALTLTVKGSKFINTTQVHFGATPLTTRWVSHTELSADLPANLLAAAGNVTVTAVTPGPGGGTSNALTFNVLGPALVLNSVTPNTLLATGQAQGITLAGANFIATSKVSFNGQPVATSFVSAAQLTAIVPGNLLNTPGTAPVLVSNTVGGTTVNSNPVTVTIIVAGPIISSFTPTSGAVGSPVTISGSNFDANAGANSVAFNGVPAIVVNATSTQLSVIVPVRATTGPISVTTKLGTAVSSGIFTVQSQQDFDISLAPASIQAPRGGAGNTRVKLTSTGLTSYPNAALVSVTGLPPGVTFKLDRPSVYLNNDVIITFNVDSTVASGVYNLNVLATGPSEFNNFSRSKPLTLEVLAAGATTVSGRVLRAEDDSPFVGARVRLGSAQTTTDATGAYRFINPALLGDQVLLVDGNTNNTATTEFPSGIPMPVMIVAGKDNVALTTFIQAVDATKFTNITPGAQATVTNPDIPNYSLNIPQGAVLTGLDGTPITKVSVRTVPVDKLPIRPVPPEVITNTVYLYYFFREGGATPTVPIPVTMNNDIGADPGEKVNLWYYDESLTPDPNSNQWRIMGQGTVSDDGKSIVSDPGVGIPKFCCGATLSSRLTRSTNSSGGNPVPLGNPCPSGPRSTNPVDYATGMATVLEDHSLGINSLFPARISCHYNSQSSNVGVLGVGTFLNFEWQVTFGNSALVLITPNGTRYNLAIGPDGVYRTSPGRAGAYGITATGNSQFITVRLQDGSKLEFTRFAGGNLLLTAMVDVNGNRITINRSTGRSNLGLPINVVDATGGNYHIDYNSSGLISRITDPIGRTLNFAYDSQSRLTSVTDPLGQVVSYDYDANNRIVQKTDRRGAITQYQYDANGRALKEIFSDGTSYGFAYNVAGAFAVTQTTVTDPNGNVSAYRFNGQGYPVKVTDALGRITTRSIDYATNQLFSETDPLGRITRYTYDANGNRTSVKDAQGNITVIEYDLNINKPLTITNALGFITRFGYDGNGNLASITNPENETTSFTYTSQGKLASLTDPLGHTTRFTYDAQGNLITTADALGNLTRNTYDSANRLIQATDARDSSAQLSYDPLDRLTQITNPPGGTTQFGYDPNGNLLSTVDGNGHAIETNAYDLRNRLTQRTDAHSLSEAYTYDGNGNVLSKTDRKGQVMSFQYDAINRLNEIRDADGRTTDYFYDLAGNIERVSDSVSGDILFTYDELNRITQVITDQGTVGYQYDAIGRRTQRTINGGDLTSYTYDKANRLVAIAYRNQTTNYQYDTEGRLVARTLPNGISQTYQYDDANRLTQIAFLRSGGTALETIAYAYDANGQRTVKANGVGSIQETPFTATYDAANRMLSYNGSALTYDANGSLIRRDTAQGPVIYTWNSRNQLAQITGPNGTASFKYDALGRRVGKTVNGQTIQYLYDKQQAIAEITGSAITATYLTGLQIDEVLARYVGTGNKTLLTDALGSVIAQANDQQGIQNFYAYTSYGETQPLGPDDNNPIQYTGRENDATGLYYYRARYYDPVLKRFIQEDPIGLQGGANFYLYVNGNPLSFTDPEGLQAGGGFPFPSSSAASNSCQVDTSPSPARNFCGAQGGMSFPNSFPGGVNINSACRAHDQCYDTPGVSRAQCDRQLLDDMLAACQNSTSPAMCRAVAQAYGGVVGGFGGGAYDATQSRMQRANDYARSLRRTGG